MPAHKVAIRRFKADTIKVGPIELGVLRLVGSEVVKEQGDPRDVLLQVAEREAGRGADLVEVEISEPGLRLVMGEGAKYEWKARITFRPERLYRIGVVRERHLEPLAEARVPGSESSEGEEAGGQGEPAAYKFKLDNIEWYKIADEDVYVYEGRVAVPPAEDVVLVVVETETGRRFIKPSRA